MKTPIFIMGTQRSGTTLLTRVLSAHPTMFIQNEAHLPTIFRHGSDKKKIIQGIKEQVEFLRGVPFSELVPDEDKMVWGLKDPQLTEYIDDLKGFLADTKFIIIVRDGRGVTNSYMENKWGLGTNAYTGALRWKREVEQQEAFMQEAPEKFLYIRYEDLVADLEGTIKKVCSHLEIEFHPSLLEYDKSQSHYVKRRENAHTYSKPNKALAEKWQKKLTPFEINVIEHVAGDTLKRNGYELVGSPIKLSALQRFYFNLHQKIIGEIQIQYRWRKSIVTSYFRRRKRLKAQAQQAGQS